MWNSPEREKKLLDLGFRLAMYVIGEGENGDRKLTHVRYVFDPVRIKEEREEEALWLEEQKRRQRDE